MKKTTLLICLLAAVLAIGTPATAARKGKAAIKFEQTSHNFGTVPEHKGLVTHEFTFVNEGKAPLVIKDASAECGCTTPEYSEAPVAPGKKGVIRVSYNPLGRPGGFTKKVTVRTNGEPRKVYLYIKGNVNPNK